MHHQCSSNKQIQLLVGHNKLKSYVGQIFEHFFFFNLSYEDRNYRSFQKDGASAHTACNSVSALGNLSGHQLVYLRGLLVNTI